MVRVTATSGRQQWNRVTTAVGYASSSDPALCSVWVKIVRLNRSRSAGQADLFRQRTNVSGGKYITIAEP